MIKRCRAHPLQFQSIEPLEQREMLSVAPLVHSRAGGLIPAIEVAYANRPTPFGALVDTGWPASRYRYSDSWQLATLRSLSHSKLPPNITGYDVSINWGDGTVNAGQISVGYDGSVYISGSHSYAANDRCDIFVKVTQGHRAGARTVWSKIIVSSAIFPG